MGVDLFTCDGRTSAWSASPCLLDLFIYQNVWWFTMYFWIQTKKSHFPPGFLGIFPILEGIPALIYKILLISSHSLFSSFVKEVFDDEGLWCWDEKGSSGVVGLPHVTGKRGNGKGNVSGYWIWIREWNWEIWKWLWNRKCKRNKKGNLLWGLGMNLGKNGNDSRIG